MSIKASSCPVAMTPSMRTEEALAARESEGAGKYSEVPWRKNRDTTSHRESTRGYQPKVGLRPPPEGPELRFLGSVGTGGVGCPSPSDLLRISARWPVPVAHGCTSKAEKRTLKSPVRLKLGCEHRACVFFFSKSVSTDFVELKGAWTDNVGRAGGVVVGGGVQRARAAA